MQFMVHLITPIIILIVLSVIIDRIFEHNNKEIIKNLKEEHIVIRLPKAYMWVGVSESAFCVICLILMYYFPNDTADLWVWIGFSVFLLLGLYIISKTLIWKVEIFRSKDYFLYKPFLKPRIIRYDECVSYKFTQNTFILKTNKKKIRIDNFATNFDFLLAILKQYKVKEIK